MELCICGHERRTHMGDRCWFSLGCARDTDPHAVCSPECKAERTCPCTAFAATVPAEGAPR